VAEPRLVIHGDSKESIFCHGLHGQTQMEQESSGAWRSSRLAQRPSCFCPIRVHLCSSVAGKAVALQHAALHLVALDALKQRLEVAFTETFVALALDDLEKDRAKRILG